MVKALFTILETRRSTESGLAENFVSGDTRSTTVWYMKPKAGRIADSLIGGGILVFVIFKQVCKKKKKKVLLVRSLKTMLLSSYG